MKLLSYLHRLLLRFPPYKKLIFAFGLDSLRYKKYYESLSYEDPSDVSYAEVDGYKGEGDFEKIVRLTAALARIIPAPSAILNIGCGTGRYLKQMSKTWPEAHLEGIDISQEIIEKFTRKQVPKAKLHILDIEKDDAFHIQNKGKFDLVCLIGIVQILSRKKIRPILRKVNLLCKDSGHAYIQFNVETPQKKSSVGYKRYSIKEFNRLLRENGFRTVKSDRTEILKDYAYIVARKDRTG